MFNGASYGPRVSPVIVLVSADRALVDTLIPHLEAEGWAWEAISDVARLLEDPSLAATLVAVDIATGGDVLAFCAAWRARSNVPLLVFAGDRREHDFVPFLEAGADDYVARPERTRELVARIRALLRRASVAGSVGSASSDEPIVVGDVTLDPNRHAVNVRGAELRLTLRQFELLHLFLTHPNQVLTRSTIFERVWGSDRSPTSNSLEVQVMRLRRWIEPDPSAPTILTTVRGVGYRYVAR